MMRSGARANPWHPVGFRLSWKPVTPETLKPCLNPIFPI